MRRENNSISCKWPFATVSAAIQDGLEDNATNASRKHGIPVTNIRRWIKFLNDGYSVNTADGHEISRSTFDREYSIAKLPDPDLPIDDIIDQMERAFDLQHEYNNAAEWLPINMTSNKPMMLCPVGDPHLDDPGCNWAQVKRDIEIFKKPGVFCVNIGDTINNWAGRLAGLYANQETSHKTAVRLGIWFVEQAKWLVWIRGNHDLWTPEGAIDVKARTVAHVSDWEAKFQIVFPNGVDVKFDTAHHFKGTSIYNRLHGGVRRAKFSGGHADFFISGHTHEWGITTDEHDFTHRIVSIIKVRGYKFHDDYAVKGGFGEQYYGSSVGIVIDPQKPDPERLSVFPSVQAGYNYLEYLRSKAS